jgi:predicted metal-dependent enzyme (double-stranded beta helix superfamily)
LLIPDTDEIHQLDNFSDRTTVEIHVYGTDLVGLPRCRYDLATGTVAPYVLGKYDNC